MNILILILWIIIGAINFATVLHGGEISTVSYFCCWVVLITYLVARCFN